MKRRIRLTENSLHRIIKETVKRVLKENTYRGVPNTQFVWHGEWADPTIIFNDEELNGSDVEDFLYGSFSEAIKDEYSQEEYKEATGKELEDTNECYNDWLKYMGTDWIKSQLEELVWASHGCP